MDGFEEWIDHQHRASVAAMLRAISPLDLVKRRPGFGQLVVPHLGSIVASPVLGDYDPDPDYFFHWFRDSAVVIDALRLLFENGVLGAEAVQRLDEFVSFSHALNSLDGRTLVNSPAWRHGIKPDFERYVRADAELEQLHGERVSADTRVNADATLDISRWARPQHDGPALRALTLLRWLPALERHAPESRDAQASTALAALLRSDLAFIRQHWHEPCFDIWEEESGSHYYTLRVAAAALIQGADWLEAQAAHDQARTDRDAARMILERLDAFWLDERGYYRSRILEGGAHSAKELDIAVILAQIHVADGPGRHSVHDPRAHATLTQLERHFEREYPINHQRPADLGTALGRYPDDRYYSGGAYYFSTLGAAEFCYRASIGSAGSAALRARGDAFLRTVRAFTPQDGQLSEQFDRCTGAQTSAKQLAWSHAAFISCIAARRTAAGS